MPYPHIVRCVQLYRILASGASLSTKQIAATLNVDAKTVLRDMKRLRKAINATEEIVVPEFDFKACHFEVGEGAHRNQAVRQAAM